MTRPRSKFRPCIDLHQGQVKQIIGGSLTDSSVEENFVADQPSSYFANTFRKDKLPGGHIIKLGPGNDDAAKEALAAWPNGLQLGGGITVDNAKDWIELGASRVIVTSFLFDEEFRFSPDRLNQLCDSVSPQRIVIDLSCRRQAGGWVVAMNRWQTKTDLDVSVEVLKRLSPSCDEFLIHAADVEGKQGGFDYDLVELLSQFDDRPVTYAGGVANMNDLRKIDELSHGKIDVTIGSALDLFGGNGLTYQELVQWNLLG